MSTEYDDRFDELTGLVKRVIGRVDEMQLEMRDMRKDVRSYQVRFDGIDKHFDEMGTSFDRIDKRFDKIEVELHIVSGRQNDVIPKVIGIQTDVNRISETQSEQTFKLFELMNRIDRVNRRLKRLDKRTVQIDTEIKEIRAAINVLIDPVLDEKVVWPSIGQIEERITRLEEKLSS
jgi:predicted  nucleic acid-binding Zn-ribbon protein